MQINEPTLTGRRRRTVFVSYSDVDRQVVDLEIKPILETLHFDKVGYFVAGDSIPPGEDWREQIFDGLAECSTFLVLVSKDSIKSSWVRRECRLALRLRGVLLISVSVDGTKPEEICSELEDRQYVVLTENRASCLSKLQLALSAGVARAGSIPGLCPHCGTPIDPEKQELRKCTHCEDWIRKTCFNCRALDDYTNNLCASCEWSHKESESKERQTCQTFIGNVNELIGESRFDEANMLLQKLESRSSIYDFRLQDIAKSAKEVRSRLAASMSASERARDLAIVEAKRRAAEGKPDEALAVFHDIPECIVNKSMRGISDHCRKWIAGRVEFENALRSNLDKTNASDVVAQLKSLLELTECEAAELAYIREAVPELEDGLLVLFGKLNREIRASSSSLGEQTVEDRLLAQMRDSSWLVSRILPHSNALRDGSTRHYQELYRQKVKVRQRAAREQFTRKHRACKKKLDDDLKKLKSEHQDKAWASFLISSYSFLASAALALFVGVIAWFDGCVSNGCSPSQEDFSKPATRTMFIVTSAGIVAGVLAYLLRRHEIVQKARDIKQAHLKNRREVLLTHKVERDRIPSDCRQMVMSEWEKTGRNDHLELATMPTLKFKGFD